MSHLKRNIPITALIAVLLASMAVAAVAQSGETPPGEGVNQVTTVAAEAEEAMDVLDTARTSSDEMPSGVAESIDERARFGMNPDLSRKAIDTLANDVYVVPAEEHICASLTVGDGANVICPPTDDVAAGEVGAAVVTLAGGAIGIYGIVPDSVESVTVHTGASASEAVAVQDNAYFTALPEGTPLRKLSYTGPSGAVEFPLYDPAAVFEE